MEKKEYFNLVKSVNDKRSNLNSKKSLDYATKDVLSNFKRLSTVASELRMNIYTPHGYALFMVLMKLDRINNLFGRKAENESIEDSFLDAHNYLDLCLACYIDCKLNLRSNKWNYL